jgi:predicted enzyme related to lactoylglutathione lyase
MRKFFRIAAAAACVFAPYAYADDAKPVSGGPVSAPIVFFDIAGPDAARLKTFYSGVFGWDIDAANAIKTAHLPGTIRQDPAEKIIYMGVPDINAALDQIKAAGGAVAMPRMVIPNVVTFALFTDPAGNRMGLVEIPKPKDAN